MVDVAPPTRAAHLEQCRVISIALVEYVKDNYEAAKFFVDLWEPRACPSRGEWP